MREFFGDVAIYLIGRAVPAAVGFASVVIFVRFLGDAGYGSYAIVFSSANLVSVIVVGWLSQAVLRFQSQATADEPFAPALRFSLGWVSVAALVGAACLPLVSHTAPGSPGVLLATGILAVGFSVHAVYAASLQAALRARSVAVLEVSRALISLPLSLAGMMLVDPRFMGALLGAGLSYAMSSSYAYFLSRRSVPQGAGNAQARRLALQFFRFGWPISVWFGISLFMPFAERVLIERFLGTAATGQYAALYDLVFRSCGFALLPIVLAVHPRIMREHGLGAVAGVRKLWAFALLMQIALGTGVTVVLALFAPQIVKIVGLPPSNDLTRLVFPLAAAGCVWQWALVAQKILEAEQRTRLMLFLLLAALVVNLTLDIILLPRFGPVAAAYSLLLAGLLYATAVSISGLGVRPVRRRG